MNTNMPVRSWGKKLYTDKKYKWLLNLCKWLALLTKKKGANLKH